jgi:chemotaxis response regulator CheB
MVVETSDAPFIIGIGASAGGLEALSLLCRACRRISG